MLSALLQNSLVSPRAVARPLAVLSPPASTLQPSELRKMRAPQLWPQGRGTPAGDARAITPRLPQCSRRWIGASTQQHCVPTRCPCAKPARPPRSEQTPGAQVCAAQVLQLELGAYPGWRLWGALQPYHSHSELRKDAVLSRLPHSPLCVFQFPHLTPFVPAPVALCGRRNLGGLLQGHLLEPASNSTASFSTGSHQKPDRGAK